MKKHKIGIDIKTTADASGAQRAEDAIEDVEDAAKDLQRELDKAKGLPPAVKDQVEGVAGSMERATVSAKKYTSSQNKLEKGSRNSGLAALEFSRAVEDAQYGIRGVLNNIPQLIQFMGGGAGLAGVVSLAAVALTQLVEAVLKTDEATERLSHTLEVARSQVEEFYAEAAKDGTAALRSNLLGFVEVLEKQSQALRDNLSLTRQKREADLRLAAAGSDLQLANIAGREASGELSPEQAQAERRALELSRMRAEVDEKILRAEEELAQAQELRALNAQQQVPVEVRLKEKQELLADAIDERNNLQARRERREGLAQRGQKLIDDSGYFSPGKRIEGQGLIDQGNIIFPEEAAQRLVELEQVIVPQNKEFVETLESTLQALQTEQGELSRAQGAAFKSLEITEEAESAILETKEAIVQTEARTEAIKGSSEDLKAGLDRMKESAGSLEDLNAFQKAALTEGMESLSKMASDGVISSEEFGRASVELRRFQTQFSASNREFAEAVSLMQVEMRRQQREIAGLKENARRISNNSGG